MEEVDMELLSLRSNNLLGNEAGLPFAVYTAGTEMQQPITRLEGFSANQLFLTFSGVGTYRPLGQDKWDILHPGTLLYIPARLPHEYMPAGDGQWHVGYVTFVENEAGLLSEWGFGEEAFQYRVVETDQLHRHLTNIWEAAGPQHDAWKGAEALFAFCLALKRLFHSDVQPASQAASEPTAVARHPVVDMAVRFLHDHLERNITMRKLAAHVGYSQKQLTRLFKQRLDLTPLQYLRQLRLKTAHLLLMDHPEMTIRQAASYVGMETEYFSRLFRRAYGMTPSESRRWSEDLDA